MMGYIWLAAATIVFLVYNYVSIARKAGSYKWDDVMDYETESPMEELAVALISIGALAVLGVCFLAVLFCIGSFINFLNQWTF